MRKPASNMRELDSASGKTPEFVSGRGLVSKRQRFSLTSTWEKDVEEAPDFVSGRGLVSKRQRFSLTSIWEKDVEEAPDFVSGRGLVSKRQRFSLTSPGKRMLRRLQTSLAAEV